MFKPEITVSFGKKTKKTSTSTPEEPTPDYVAIAEEALSRLGKKLIVGAVVVVATTVILSAVSNAALITLDHTLNNE